MVLIHQNRDAGSQSPKRKALKDPFGSQSPKRRALKDPSSRPRALSLEDSCAKSPSKEKPKAHSRQLVIVLPDKAAADVQSKLVGMAGSCQWPQKKVPAKKWSWLPHVRRNKKIKKIIQMDKAESTTQTKAHVMTSKKGLLSEAGGVYGKIMLECLEHLEAFDFKRNKDLHGWVYDVSDNRTPASSGSVVMQSDFPKKELVSMIADLKGDVGVLKRSVVQLLSKKTHDVIAVNTHPGHHAGPQRISNYCALNNVAIAAQLIKTKAPNQKVGVIDIDVHAGDGTHDFIKENPRLVNKYVSIHSPIRFVNMNSDLGKNGSSLKLNNMREICPERYIANLIQVLEGFNKKHLDIIIVSLGFDTLKHDPEAGDLLGYQMLPVHFKEVGHVFAQRPEQIFFIQEGGYNLNETAKAFDYLMKGFRRGRKSYERGNDENNRVVK